MEQKYKTEGYKVVGKYWGAYTFIRQCTYGYRVLEKTLKILDLYFYHIFIVHKMFYYYDMESYLDISQISYPMVERFFTSSQYFLSSFYLLRNIIKSSNV